MWGAHRLAARIVFKGVDEKAKAEMLEEAHAKLRRCRSLQRGRQARLLQLAPISNLSMPLQRAEPISGVVLTQAFALLGWRERLKERTAPIAIISC